MSYERSIEFRVGKLRVFVSSHNVSSWYLKKKESAQKWLESVLADGYKAVMEDHPDFGYCKFFIESTNNEGEVIRSEAGIMNSKQRFHFIIHRSYFNEAIIQRKENV